MRPPKKATRKTIIPNRKKNGDIIFSDHPEFKPNLTPKEIFHLGSFGGTYFRPIYSSITKKKYKDEWKKFPKSWFPTNIERYVSSEKCDPTINKYGKKSGTSLKMWEEKGWIEPIDPYGWVQWYLNFYKGRRSYDDERQIDRFNKVAGENSGRWRKNLMNKIEKKGIDHLDDYKISPTIRQLLQQWAFVIKKHHFN